MKSIGSIFKFVVLDNLRSIWAVAYMLFLAASTSALIYFTGSFTRSMVSIMNIIILITPLVSTMMTSMYYYNKTDFIHLLLAQPISRKHTFLGLYLGIAFTQSLAIALGMGIGILASFTQLESLQTVLTLVGAGIILSLVFSALSMLISVSSNDKLKGIGLALFVWLFMAVIYDGLMLMYFLLFSEYPIEEHAIILSLMNPIDLSRIFVMLQLDVSALMGYSGAVFNKFFGAGIGKWTSAGALILWVVLPVLGFLRTARKKDY